MEKCFRDREGVELPRGFPFERDGFAFAANWLDLASADDLERFGFSVAEVDTPAPPPPTAPTPIEKLNAIGLTVDDLKEMLS